MITNEIWLGDCVKLMNDIPDKSVDLVVCDPPYGKTSLEWDKCLNFSDIWHIYDRILVDNGTVVLFGSGIFTAKLICSNEKWFKYSLVWRKSKCGSSLLAKYRPMMKHEDVIVFTKRGKKHATFNPTLNEGEPYRRKLTKIKLNNHGYGVNQTEADNKGTRYADSILDFPQKWRRQDQIHPTQKPVELLEYLIKTYSNEEDLILDNCAGSGTSLLAAKNLNRRFIGIEKDENYYEICLERLKQNEN